MTEAARVGTPLSKSFWRSICNSKKKNQNADLNRAFTVFDLSRDSAQSERLEGRGWYCGHSHFLGFGYACHDGVSTVMSEKPSDPYKLYNACKASWEALKLRFRNFGSARLLASRTIRNDRRAC